MKVRAYTKFNQTYDFPAKDINNAREIAKRIVMEGLWVIENNEEIFFPITQIIKVKILEAQ